MPWYVGGYPPRVRLVTFNILNGRAQDAHEVDVSVLARAVKELDPDVLALQEVDRNQPRSQGHDLTAVAAEAMGADEHRFVAALAGSPGATWTAATGEEQPDAAAYGIALLSRFPVSSWQVVRLPRAPFPTPMRFRGRLLPTLVHDEPRVAVAAHVQAPSGELTVCTTHLSFIPWWNGRQLHDLVKSLVGCPRPLLVTGDLNMGPERAAAISRLTGVEAGPTFPADAPTEQLDHILADPPLPVRAEVRQLPLSDHCALVVDLP